MTHDKILHHAMVIVAASRDRSPHQRCEKLERAIANLYDQDRTNSAARDVAEIISRAKDVIAALAAKDGPPGQLTRAIESLRAVKSTSSAASKLPTSTPAPRPAASAVRSANNPTDGQAEITASLRALGAIADEPNGADLKDDNQDDVTASLRALGVVAKEESDKAAADVVALARSVGLAGFGKAKGRAR